MMPESVFTIGRIGVHVRSESAFTMGRSPHHESRWHAGAHLVPYHFHVSRLWVNAYTNNVSFYVASQRMIPEGGYEVDRSMVYYGHPAPFAPQTEDQIIRAVLDLIPRSFAR